jgi:hypothetical protein
MKKYFATHGKTRKTSQIIKFGFFSWDSDRKMTISWGYFKQLEFPHPS